MHIADGYLDVKTSVVTAGLAVAGMALALRAVRQSLPPRKMPLLGLAAAFIFAAQMLNFPVVAGTSGHLTGGALAAILLGLGPAVVVMCAVLILQCFLFADGGVTALGANLFNMAVVAPCVGYAVFRGLQRVAGPSRRALLVATAVAAWCSTVLAAGFCSAELAFSGTAAFRVVVPAMAGIHALIGVVEAVITALVVRAVLSGESVWQPGDGARLDSRTGFAFALLFSFALALFVAPFACPWPDGLESVAEWLGFSGRGSQVPLVASPLSDYTLPGIGHAGLATALAGAFGTAAIFLIFRGLCKRSHRQGSALPPKA
ncbi:MAG: energy-coupling factor ABC transporter permease [bacterium]